MKGFVKLSILLTAISGVTQAADLYVNTNGSGVQCLETDPCSTIQAAVDYSAEGDVIHVAAGTYYENVSLGGPKSHNTSRGITITGEGDDETFVVSAGGKGQRPAGVPADIIFDIWSANVTIEKLSIEHPATSVTKRDIGIFVGPPASNTTIQKTSVVRNRTGSELEPWKPGSRGILVFRAVDSLITKNEFSGNYEDHIHMPTSSSTISKNEVSGATRLGIVIIQESEKSNAKGSIIIKNEVEDSGSDGIQIQGDNNFIADNEVEDSAGAGIKLCGIVEEGDCVNPFDAWSEASGNIVSNNELEDNAQSVVDNG
ncbi:MAG: right-handed parallel beta-helix repeat-containing protein, partial [Gammaproteobacteria bacterium]|nr:right-handed parallel beta-helix repeat-containing protein [Gammaproteobacteria bacterium]